MGSVKLGPNTQFPALLVEDAVISIQAQMFNQFNANLEFVYQDMLGFDTTVVGQPATVFRNLPFIEPERYYITEAIDPVQCPSVFIIPDRTEHNNRAQNYIWQEHSILVGFLVEDVEATNLTRIVWRYVRAAYMTLHDKSLGNIHCLVEGVDYGPIFHKLKGSGRQFRKDATLRLKVMHLERF
jgi:hypothetical protein